MHYSREVHIILASKFMCTVVTQTFTRGYEDATGGSTIDIEYNKRLDRQRPCLEDDLTAGSNNIVQSNKSV